ncbi:MAG: 30S ribosomal protein S27e [Candidatus Diapherotrites archaeon]
MKISIPRPKTKFLRVKCDSCGNEQVMFSAPSSTVKCLVCEKVLAEPKASKPSIKSKILREY